MNMRWFKSFSRQEDKDKFKQRLTNAEDIFSVLKDILREDLDAIDKDMMSKDHYLSRAWTEYQADRIGSKRTLTKVIELLP